MFKLLCGISCFYLLWAITTQLTSLKYLTGWTVCFELLYFISEFHHNRKLATFFQNLIWAPSIFLLIYWPLSLILKWKKDNYSIFSDLSVHFVNVILVILAVKSKPKLKKKLLFVPFAFALSYLTFAIIYTHCGNEIYPSNFFDTNKKILIDFIIVSLACPGIHYMGIYLFTPKIPISILSIPLMEHDNVIDPFET